MDEPAVKEERVALARARGFQFVQDGGVHGHYNRLVKLMLFILSLGGRMFHATKLASAKGRLAAAVLLGFAAPAAAQAPAQPDAVSVYAMTPERLGASPTYQGGSSDERDDSTQWRDRRAK